MPGTADRILARVQKLLDELGVERAIVVVDDMDSPNFVRHVRGGKLWGIGAAKYVEASCLEELLAPDDDE